MNRKNQQVIEEFRANGGVVTVVPPRGPVLLLHTTGARTGQQYVTPLLFGVDGDRYVIIASKGGWKYNPDWYYNLLAHPETIIEVGTEVLRVKAVEVAGAERDRLYDILATRYPQFAYYRRKTRRTIPVLVLERIAEGTS